MKNRIFVLILIIALIFNIAVFGKPPLERPAKSPVISHRLENRMSSSDAATKLKVWIFFTDKGVFDQTGYNAAISKLREIMPEKSLRRRMNRVKSDEKIDYYDIPVNQGYLNSIKRDNVEIIHQSRWLNAVSIRADKYAIEEIAKLPFISEIRLVAVGTVRPETPDAYKPQADLPDSIVALYGNSYTQLDLENIPILHQFGLSGEGIRIALLDAGFDLTYAFFNNINVVDQYDFVDNDPIAKEDDPDLAAVENRHGTLVLSVIGGYAQDQLIGPAYGAEYLLARTEIADPTVEIPLEEDNWVAAAEWADSLGADIISTSLGYYDWYDYSDLDGNTAVITIAADLAVSRGIAVFASAGNTRNTSFYHITPPADGDSVIAVGSVGSNGVIAGSSGAGPTYDGRIKPDIVAMGIGVYAYSSAGAFSYVSGTSFAAPIAAGAGALLLQAHPEWSPIDIRTALVESADRFNNPDDIYGYGLFDAFSAARLMYINPVAPVILAIGDSLDLTFAVTGLPDSVPAFEALNLPANAIFTDNGDRTATLRYLASAEDVGTRLVQIIAGFGSGSYTLELSFTVVAQAKIAAGPNPFTDSLTIFIGPDDGRLSEISIHTANGEKVWDRFSDTYNVATATAVWHGENNYGAKVASGVYFVIVTTDKLMRKIKVFKR